MYQVINPQEALKVYIAESKLRYQPNTSEDYTRYIRMFLESIPNEKGLNDITRGDLISWLSACELHAPRTVAFKLASIKSFINFCQENDYVQVNASILIKPPKTKETIPLVIDPIMMFKIREATHHNVRIRSMIELLFTSGIRASELINIRIEDLNLECNQIWIREGKGLKERIVLITTDCKSRIRLYLNTQPKKQEYLFVNQHGRKLTGQGLSYIFKQCFKDAQLSINLDIRSFRRTFASNLLEKGVQIEYIKELMGHEDISTTLLYTRIPLI